MWPGGKSWLLWTHGPGTGKANGKHANRTCNSIREFSTGKTGRPFDMFQFIQRIFYRCEPKVFHLPPNRNFRKIESAHFYGVRWKTATLQAPINIPENVCRWDFLTVDRNRVQSQRLYSIRKWFPPNYQIYTWNITSTLNIIEVLVLQMANSWYLNILSTLLALRRVLSKEKHCVYWKLSQRKLRIAYINEIAV